jgi:hypothetical protein
MRDGSRLPIASLEMSELRTWSPAPTLTKSCTHRRRCRLYVEIKAAAAVEPVVER